ncbi:MAG TPA: hypothetical protein VJS64_02370 [Pyrinomonadaceae bacterium]|nr:hypothetical protein [Pyrinomonadaceae bacterium]
MKRVCVLVALAFLAGCSKHTTTAPTFTPTPTPRPLVASLKKEIEADDDSTELRENIRDFVVDYLKASHPTWRVHGISLSRIEGDSEYDIRADMDVDSNSKIVKLRAWYFIQDNGEGYWKVVEMETL